ncbi:O-antigen ligase family protein [Pseudodesulfovibrio piezophilus]|nr:O-antigen ligase family protein [Pseudodesulfovibrio piezophilus]
MIVEQIIEIHIQAVIGVCCGYFLLNIIGPKRLGKSFLMTVFASGILALFQFAHVDFAWNIREYLQQYQNFIDVVYLTERSRAFGLSLTPVHLATQVCYGFAVWTSLRLLAADNYQNKHMFRIALKPLTVMIIFAVASGNRSPLLGFGIFILVALFFARPLLTLLVGTLTIPLLFVLCENYNAVYGYFKGYEIRALRVGDKSSQGREVLRAYGWLLFRYNPFGYGLNFSSVNYASKFWSQISQFENAQSILVNAVHNYYLNILHKYGILILPVAFYVFRTLIRHLYILMIFIPYIVHAYFHNDGPLQSDFIIWYFIPLFQLVVSNISSDSKEA